MGRFGLTWDAAFTTDELDALRIDEVRQLDAGQEALGGGVGALHALDAEHLVGSRTRQHSQTMRTRSLANAAQMVLALAEDKPSVQFR